MRFPAEILPPPFPIRDQFFEMVFAAMAAPRTLGLVDQLLQLKEITYDGDLLSKDQRRRLIDRGYAQSCQGWNFLTAKGIGVLVDLELLKP